MVDQQPPPYVLFRMLKGRSNRYGTRWILTGVAVVAAALVLLAWLLSR